PTRGGHLVSGANGSDRLVFSEVFIAANRSPTIDASRCQPGTYNYFIGNDRKRWTTHVQGYAEVTYHDLWEGVDLKVYGNGANLEQEFKVRSGADLGKIQVSYQGIDGLEVAPDGSLLIHTVFGELR